MRKILKKFMEPIQSYEDVPFSGPKLFLEKTINFFLSTYWPFSLCKIFKFLEGILSYKDAPFIWPKIVHLPQFFLEKIINIIFIYLLAPLIVQNFRKNSCSRSRVMRMCPFGPKMAHLPK